MSVQKDITACKRADIFTTMAGGLGVGLLAAGHGAALLHRLPPHRHLGHRHPGRGAAVHRCAPWLAALNPSPHLGNRLTAKQDVHMHMNMCERI